MTGKCDCPINRLTADDCSVCSNGWDGTDCDMTINEGVNTVTDFITTVGQLGLVYTLDGINYAVKTQSELLLLAISDNVVIEGKFVTCYQNYSCLPFLAARIGDSSNGYATITVQSKPIYYSKPVIYVNGVFSSLDSPAYFNGFSVYRSNFFEVTFEVKNLITFHIRTQGQYLHFTTTVPQNYVQQTSGLLSGALYENTTDKLDHIYSSTVPVFDICSDTSSVQSVQGSESTTILSLTPFTQTSGSETSFDISRFVVDACNNIIYFPSNEYKDQTQGGYGLCFSKSSINHELSTAAEMTLELMVKQNQANYSGVMFSFTSNVSLLVVGGQSSVEIHTYVGDNETVYDTGLELDVDYWNKLVLTYDNLEGKAAVYVIDKNSATSTSGEIALDTGLFSNTGMLTIGHWQGPSDSMHYSLPSGFEGCIENFMVWNIRVLDNEVAELWKMDPVIPTESLLLSLQFNEGDGLLTTDNIADIEITLPTYPWKAPEWLVSDLEYLTTSTPDIALIYFSNTSWMNEAYTLCTSHIFSAECASNNATKEFYFVLCQQVLSATKDKVAGYNTILDYLRLCESQHNMASSDITSFCTDLDNTYRNGTSCATTCEFGLEYSNGTCVCFTGYYGAACDQVCPGRSDSPCSDRGECQSDGTCKCWWNWKGSSDCSSCTTDSTGSMTGPDCSILDTTSLSSGSEKLAAVSSNGYYMTFEGQQISFTGESGVFMLFDSTHLGVEIHVYQVSCLYGSCIAAISIASLDHSAVIAPAGQGYKPLLYIDGDLTEMDDITATYDSGSNGILTVKQNSLTEISVTITTIGSITVSVLAQEQFLQAAITTSNTVCQGGTGVFGDCSGGKDYSTMTESEISSFVIDNFRLSSSIILDALEAPVGDGSAITGYALKFNKTAVMSGPISYPTGFSPTDIDFSLSIYFKPSVYGGYIVSYSKVSTFAILNTNPIQIQYSATIVTTSFTADLDVWNQLILTFRRDTGQIDIYHFGIDTKIATETISLNCPDIFESAGTVMLGEYLPVVNGDEYTYTSNSYVGLIDEFTIWKYPIPNNLVYQAHLLSTKASGFTSELASLFSFTEGVGAVAFEQVNGNNLKLPSSPWQSPSWIVSDLALVALRTTVSEVYTTINIDADVEANCSAFFDSVTVTSSCSSVSEFIRWWYKQLCMITATNSGNISDTTMSMVDFTSVCSIMGETTTDVYSEMCNLGINFPGWLTQKCSNCDFGFKSNGACVCLYGYYGSNCDNVCPGGVNNPCSGNGNCDVGGNCQCIGHWTGTDCTTCEADWSGQDCNVYAKSTYDPLGNNTDTLVAQVNLIGQLSTFDGTILDMPLRGYYKLLSIGALDIELHARFSVCTSNSALHVCLVGFVIVHANEKYYISYKAYETASVEIMTSSSTLDLNLFDTLTIGSITLKRESQTTVTMIIIDSDLIVKLSSINSRLLATMSLPRTEWDSRQADIAGVMTACKTSVAIVAANCNVTRDSICTDPSQDIPDYCEIPLTKDALKQFLSNDQYTDAPFIATVEERYISAMESNCLRYSGTGVAVTSVTLPSSDFTIELHVQPMEAGGIILTYDYNGEYIIIINHVNGLMVVLDGVYYTTTMSLQLNAWNQISLAWRDDVSILEVYVTDNLGK